LISLKPCAVAPTSSADACQAGAGEREAYLDFGEALPRRLNDAEDGRVARGAELGDVLRRDALLLERVDVEDGRFLAKEMS
jgi:hypothetical protein